MSDTAVVQERADEDVGKDSRRGQREWADTGSSGESPGWRWRHGTHSHPTQAGVKAD